MKKRRRSARRRPHRRGRVPRALRPLRGARARLPPPPHRDEDAAHELTAETFAQAWLARGALPRRVRRLGRAVAVRDRPQRAAGLRPPRRAGGARPRAPRHARSTPVDASTRRRRWLDEALDELPDAPARGRPAAGGRRPELRRGRRRARHDPGAARVRVHRGLAATAQGEDPMTARLCRPRRRARARRRADLRRRRGARRRRVARRRAPRSRSLAPGGALAASLLTSRGRRAARCPPARAFLVGTSRTCEVVKDGVEYHCTIKGAFESEIDGPKGTVEPTVDATKHVNGGCRSLRPPTAAMALLHRRGGRPPADHRARTSWASTRPRRAWADLNARRSSRPPTGGRFRASAEGGWMRLVMSRFIVRAVALATGTAASSAQARAARSTTSSDANGTYWGIQDAAPPRVDTGSIRATQVGAGTEPAPSAPRSTASAASRSACRRRRRRASTAS